MVDLRALAHELGLGNRYVGTLITWHDGDTGHITVLDPLLSVPVTLAVRLVGINCPELTEPGGHEVTAALEEWLPPGQVVTLTGVKPDKFAGRCDAAVATADGTDVSTWLLSQGYAVPWSGLGAKPHVPWPPAV